jgi:hypothetical protein
MANFKQCKFRRGDAYTVAWIEERGAKVGANVELKTADGEFWEVVEVYDYAMDEAALRQKQANDRQALPSIIGR